jgi:hypothetical protein
LVAISEVSMTPSASKRRLPCNPPERTPLSASRTMVSATAPTTAKEAWGRTASGVCWMINRVTASAVPRPRFTASAERKVACQASFVAASVASASVRAILRASTHGMPAPSTIADSRRTFCSTLTAPNSERGKSHTSATPNP